MPAGGGYLRTAAPATHCQGAPRPQRLIRRLPLSKEEPTREGSHEAVEVGGLLPLTEVAAKLVPKKAQRRLGLGGKSCMRALERRQTQRQNPHPKARRGGHAAGPAGLELQQWRHWRRQRKQKCSRPKKWLLCHPLRHMSGRPVGNLFRTGPPTKGTTTIWTHRGAIGSQRGSRRRR